MGKTRLVKDSRPPEAASWLRPALAISLAIVAAAYVLWFLQAAPPPQAGQLPLRLALLSELRDPFGFVAQWFGPAGAPLGLMDRVPVLAMAGLILAAAYGIGRVAIDGLRMAAEATELERCVFGVALGLNLVSTLMLGLGLAGFLQQRWLLWVLVAVGVCLAAWQFKRDHWSRLCSGSSAFRIPPSAFLWLAVAFSTLIFLGACLPPWDFDVLEYHLQVPKEWHQAGQIAFLPHNVYGNMPLAAEMPALLAMGLWPGEHGWFNGALAGKVVMASFAIITALGLAAAGERLAGRWAGWLAACVFLAHPWVVHVSISGLNDGALACYVLLAAYSMWLARRGACSYLLPGLLAGAAAACKYPGLAFAVAPLAVWCCIPKAPTIGRSELPGGEKAPAGHSPRDVNAHRTPTTGRGFVIRSLILFLCGALAGGGAWYAKNTALAGNPVYPLAYEVFGGKTRTPEKHEQWQRAHRVPPDSAGRKYSLNQMAGSFARLAGRDELASPLFIPLLLAAILALGLANLQSAIRNPQLLLPFAALLILVLAVWWLFSHRIDRFLLPAWPLAALIGAVGAARWDDRWGRTVIQTICFAGLAFCLLAASSTMLGDNRWFVALEQLRRDQPWPNGTPLRVKLEHQFLNEHRSPGHPLGGSAPREESISRSEMPTVAVLLVGEAAPFDLEMPAYYNTCFDSCLLCDWTLGKSADERREELSSRKIAWVLVDWPEIERYRLPGNYGFDPRFTPQLIDELVAQGVLGPPRVIQPRHLGRPAELYPVRGSPAEQAAAAGVQ